MFGWITSPRESRDSKDSSGGAGDCEDNTAMADLMIGEVEAAVYDFECGQELRRSQVSLQERTPDYTWLISTDSTQKPKKFLTMQERANLHRACEMLRTPQEWSSLSGMWRNKKAHGPSTREHIISSFVQAINDIVGMRPRPQTVGSILTRYLRSQSSVNAISDSPREPSTAPVSARSFGSISFRSLNDVV